MKALDLAQIVAVLAPLAIVVHWLTDGAKDLTNRNWNGLTTRALAFLIGFGVVALAAHSTINFGGGSTDVLANLGWADEILVGLLIAATAGTVLEKIASRALNSADTNVSPTLLPGASSSSLPAAPKPSDPFAIDPSTLDPAVTEAAA